MQIATVVTERLTDGSDVHNVHLDLGDGREVVFGAAGKLCAAELAVEINRVSWVEVRGREDAKAA